MAKIREDLGRRGLLDSPAAVELFSAFDGFTDYNFAPYLLNPVEERVGDYKKDRIAVTGAR